MKKLMNQLNEVYENSKNQHEIYEKHKNANVMELNEHFEEGGLPAIYNQLNKDIVMEFQVQSYIQTADFSDKAVYIKAAPIIRSIRNEITNHINKFQESFFSNIIPIIKYINQLKQEAKPEYVAETTCAIGKTNFENSEIGVIHSRPMGLIDIPKPVDPITQESCAFYYIKTLVNGSMAKTKVLFEKPFNSTIMHKIIEVFNNMMGINQDAPTFFDKLASSNNSTPIPFTADQITNIINDIKKITESKNIILSSGSKTLLIFTQKPPCKTQFITQMFSSTDHKNYYYVYEETFNDKPSIKMYNSKCGIGSLTTCTNRAKQLQNTCEHKKDNQRHEVLLVNDD